MICVVSSRSSSFDLAGPLGVALIATDLATTPEVAGAKALAEATRAARDRKSFILMYYLNLILSYEPFRSGVFGSGLVAVATTLPSVAFSALCLRACDVCGESTPIYQ